MNKEFFAKSILEICELESDKSTFRGAKEPFRHKVKASLLGVVIFEADWSEEITEEDLINGMMERYCEGGLLDIHEVALQVPNIATGNRIQAFLETERLRKKLDWVLPREFELSN